MTLGDMTRARAAIVNECVVLDVWCVYSRRGPECTGVVVDSHVWRGQKRNLS